MSVTPEEQDQISTGDASRRPLNVEQLASARPRSSFVTFIIFAIFILFTIAAAVIFFSGLPSTENAPPVLERSTT